MFWLSYECFPILCDAFLLKVSFPAIAAVSYKTTKIHLLDNNL